MAPKVLAGNLINRPWGRAPAVRENPKSDNRPLSLRGLLGLRSLHSLPGKINLPKPLRAVGLISWQAQIPSTLKGVNRISQRIAGTAEILQGFGRPD